MPLTLNEYISVPFSKRPDGDQWNCSSETN